MSIKELLIETGIEHLLIQDSCTQDYLQTVVDYIEEHFELIIVNKKDLHRFNWKVIQNLTQEIIQSEIELNKVTDEDYIHRKAKENEWLNS